VRYVLRVKLDSTNASLRQMCRDCGFVVCRPLDLNQISPLDTGTPRHWTSAAAAYVDDQLPPLDVSLMIVILMKKSARRRRKHSALAVVRRSQKFLALPQTTVPGARDVQNLTSWRWSLYTFTYRPSLVRIDARNFELSW